MGCSRGAASPDTLTQRRLFASSAGHCQNPGCTKPLFVDVGGQTVTISELAHVFAANDGGPRAKAELTKDERGAFDNLVVLCADCHTVVDKAPDVFTDIRMLAWKQDHANKLQALFGAVQSESRARAREAIEPILTTNYTIFRQYGPHIESAANPESGSAEQWKRKMLTSILPNNRRLLSILDANRRWLRDAESVLLEEFRQHIDDLEAYHLGESDADASRFPPGFAEILRG